MLLKSGFSLTKLKLLYCHRYPLGSPYLSGIVKSTTSHFNSTEKYDEVIVTDLSHKQFSQTVQMLSLKRKNLMFLSLSYSRFTTSL